MRKNPLKVKVAGPGKTDTEVPAEHIAAIAAAVAAVCAGIPEEHLVAIAAALAVYEAGLQTVPIVRIRRGQKAWTLAGRQDVMFARKFA